MENNSEKVERIIQFWNPRSVNKILSNDEEAKENVLPNLNGLNVFSKFDEAKLFDEEEDGLYGITFSKQKQIYINSDITNKEAASTIYHEFHHTMHKTPNVKSNTNRKKKEKEDLNNEVDTWAREYEFKIRQGMITQEDVDEGYVKEIKLENGTKSYLVDRKKMKQLAFESYEEDSSSGKRSARFNPDNWNFTNPVNLLTWNWNQ